MTDQTELWRPIIGFRDGYEASSLGRIRSSVRKNPRILTLSVVCGYLQCSLQKKNGVGYSALVHRIVFEAFRGPIPDGMHIDHIDHDRTNNRINNLQALTPAENMARRDARRWPNGGRPSHCPRGHEYTPQNTYIRVDGKYRLCRACARIRQRIKNKSFALTKEDHESLSCAAETLRQIVKSNIAHDGKEAKMALAALEKFAEKILEHVNAEEYSWLIHQEKQRRKCGSGE